MRKFKTCYAPLILLIPVLISTPSSAQRLGVAFRGGPAFTSFHTTGTPASAHAALQGVTGYTFGVALSGVDLIGGFGARLELNYVQMGAARFDSGDSGSWSATLTAEFDYAQVPVLVQYRYKSRGVVHPRVFAGPYWSFSFGDLTTANYEGTHIFVGEKLLGIIPFCIEYDACSPAKREFGFIIGAGVDLDLLLDGLLVEARYIVGATDLGFGFVEWKSEGSATFNPELNHRNRGLAVLVGIRL